MMRRRPIARTAARTAVVAGTATAVSGRVSRRQQAKAEQPPPSTPAPPAPPAGMSSAEQLTALAGLREQGLLTDAEFEAEKAKILAGG